MTNTEEIKVAEKTYTKPEIRALVVKYVKLNAKKKKIEEEMNAIKGVLKEVARDAYNKKYYVGEHTIVLTEYDRTTVDYKRLAVEHPRIAKKFITTTPVESLTVK